MAYVESVLVGSTGDMGTGHITWEQRRMQLQHAKDKVVLDR